MHPKKEQLGDVRGMIREKLEERLARAKEEKEKKNKDTSFSDVATSPILLSLMLEVYKKEGNLPAQRVELPTKNC